MSSPKGPLTALNFMIVILLCCKGIHSKLQKPAYPTQLASFDSFLQTKADIFSTEIENHCSNNTLFFYNLHHARSTPFDIRKRNSYPAYLFSLLISAPGDVQVNPDPGVSGPADPDSSVGSTYPCGTCDENVTWSRNAVFCETCCIWSHVYCQDIGSTSFQVLQVSNVS